jgi:hypothetical protein
MKTRAILFAVLAALAAIPAAAQVPQFPQTLQPNTVVGRLGIGPGPAQDIPFSSILQTGGAVLTALTPTSQVKGDCTTDDSTALNNLLATSNTSVLLPNPPGGCYAIANSISIGNGSVSAGSTVDNVVLAGVAVSGGNSIIDPAAKTIKIKWIGASGGTMLKLNGPGTFGLKNLELDANNGTASICGTFNHIYRSNIENVTCSQPRAGGTGFQHYAYPAQSTVFIGACDNHWANLFVNSNGFTGVTAYDIGNHTLSGIAFDVCRDTFDNVVDTINNDAGSIGLQLNALDAVTFKNFFSSCPTTTGALSCFALKIVPPGAGQPAISFPTNVTFIAPAFVGQYSIPNNQSTWVGNIFFAGNFSQYNWAYGIPLPANSFGQLQGQLTNGQMLGSVTRAVTSTTDTITAADSNRIVTYNNASTIGVIIPQSYPQTIFGPKFRFFPQNLGAGNLTLNTYNSGTAVVGGTPGGLPTITFTSAGALTITGSPITITAAGGGGSTLLTQAASFAAQINGNANLTAAGISATSNGNNVYISLPLSGVYASVVTMASNGGTTMTNVGSSFINNANNITLGQNQSGICEADGTNWWCVVDTTGVIGGAFQSGMGVGPLPVAGKIFTTSGTAATAAGTTEQTLATYSLPASALDIAGRRLRIKGVFNKNISNADNITSTIYFGAKTFTTGTFSAVGTVAELTMDVVKAGSNSQIVTATGVVGVTPLASTVVAGTETDTNAIVIKATCTDAVNSAGDCVLWDFSVEYLN